MRTLTMLLSALAVLAITAPSAYPTAPDPLLRRQWGLSMIHAPGAWPYTEGQGAIVAVVDTGVDLGHPDLESNIIPGGIDLVDHDRDPSDENGHGTHVAGTVAAARNGIGVVGVAPEAQLLVIRACAQQCPASTVARGIRYAVDHGAAVINLSLVTGFVAEQDDANRRVRAAVGYAATNGVVVVAAAGNYALPICLEPAATAICVGSVNSDRVKTLYSDADTAMRSNYLVAPGGDDLPYCESIVFSTFPRNLESVCGRRGFEAMNGTSMASAHVAGVAALLISQGLEADEVVQRIIDATSDLGLPGRDPVYGFGLLDARKAVRM